VISVCSVLKALEAASTAPATIRAVPQNPTACRSQEFSVISVRSVLRALEAASTAPATIRAVLRTPQPAVP
jgi:hypothetical protein